MHVLCVLGVLVAVLSAAGASADVGINKSFVPNSVSAGQTSTLTIVFLNPNPAAATGTAVTDTLPANVVVASPANATTTCGGTVTATPGAGSVTLSGGSIPAAVGNTSGSCHFTVGVLSNTPGTYINTLPIGAVASSQGSNSQAAQATLVATALANITGTKVFAPTVVHAGGSAAAMTITLSNANGVALTNAAFTDTFPANLVLNTPPNVATTCASGTASGVAGGNTVQLAGATIPANGSCKITASVVTPNPDIAVNAARTNALAAGAITTAQGVSNSAISGNITVQSGAAVTKLFSAASIISGNPATLTITVSNFNATALAGITFTDTFPGTMVVATPANASTTCGGTLTATPGAGSVNLTGGSLTAAPAAAGARTCTITVSVTATNLGASAQTLVNTNAAGTFGTVNYTGGSANLIVNPASVITGTKSYSPLPVVQSGTATATVTLTNNTGSAATITGFTDNLTTLGTGFTVAAAPAPGGTCGATISAPVGGTLVTASGGSIPARGSCTITFPIAIGITVASGGHTNTIAANAVQTTQGNNTLAITGLMDLGRAFTAAKAYAPATVQAGKTSTLTVTFTHSANAVPLSNLSFTDTLPAGHTIASPANAATTCGGTLTANPGAGSFSLAGGALGAGATSCTVTVSVQAPGSTGNATNTVAAGAVTTAEGATNAAFTAVLTRVNTSVTINKAFTPATVAVGGTSQVAIQIRNNNAGAIQLTNVGLVDPLPVGIQPAVPAGLAFTGSGCTSGSILISSGVLTLGGATINANSICTLSANVKATAAGNLINTLPVGIITSAQGVTNPAAAAATLASSGTAFLSITKSDGVTTVTPGGTTTYTINVANTGPNDVAGLSVDDTPPAGMTFTSWSCAASSGSQCTATGSGPIADVVTLLNGGTLTYTVNAVLAAGASGSVTNTASLGVPGAVIDTNPVTAASDTDTVAPITALVITKDDGATTYTPGLTGVYTVVVTNGGPSDALGVTVADALPAGVTLAGSVSCVASGGASCGAVSGSAGATSFGATGASVPAGGGAQLAFSVPVAFGAGMSAASITNTVTVTDAPSGGSASASDTDTRAAQVSLSASKSDGAATYVPGGTATYVVTIGNAGVSAALDVTVADPLPAGVVLNGAAGCVASAGSSCGAVAGAAGATSAGATGALIAPGGSLVFTLPVRYGAAMTAASITNTVSVTDAASGAAATASDTDTRAAQVALALTKTDGSASYTPGGSATYVVVVTNTGLSDAHGVTVADTLPAGVTLSAAATCTAAGSANCGTLSGATGAAAAGLSGATIAAGAGNSLTLQLPVAFAAGLTADPLVNTVSATDPDDPLPRSASDSDTRAASVALQVTKSDGSASYTPGGTAVYTVTVTNAGPSDALDVALTDALPAGVTLTAAVGCVATGNAACGAVSGIAGQTSFAAIGGRVGAGAGDALTFTAPVAFAAGLATDPLVNTATATDAATGATASGSDSDTRSLSVSLAVAKSDGSATYMPGGSATYTVTVTNGGISDASDVTLADALPFGVTLTGNVMCVASGDAACGAVSGSAGQAAFGATGARIAAGAANAIVMSAPVAFATGLATDPLINTANAFDAPSGAAGAGSDSDARLAQVSLAVTKTDNQAVYVPGATASYVVQVANTGASDALDVTVADALPAGVTLDGAVSCVPAGDASCGSVTGSAGQASFGATAARIAAGAGNTLTFNAPVRFASGLVDDPLVNTAVATDLASGASGSASDSDARLAQPGLTLIKSDGSATYTPGGTATYAVIVTNAGPTDAADVTVTDALPAGATLAASVTCVASGSASCGALTGAAGGSSFAANGARVPAGVGNALTFSVPVTFAAGMTTDPLVNVVSALDVASGTSASASDSDARSPSVSLSVVKSDGTATYTPGGAGTYTITVTNGGSSDATAVTVSDALPPGVTLGANAGCVASGGSSCGTVSGLAGQTSLGATGARVAAGPGSALVLTAPVLFAAGLATNPLVNTATAVDGVSGAAGSGSDADALGAQATLTIAKTDNASVYVPGGAGTYVVTIGNAGPSNATDVAMADNLPAGVTLSASAACTASGAASCGAVSGAAGASAVSVTGAAIAAGPGNALIITMPVAFDPALAVDPLVNTASASAPGAAPVAATDADARAAAAGLALTNTDNRLAYVPGDNGTYVLTLQNGGPSNAQNVVVTDTLPAGVTLRAGAACAATGLAACGTLAGTVGGSTLTMSGGMLGAGAGNRLVVSVPVRFAPSLRADPLVNPATASATGAAPVSAADSDTLDIRAGLALAKTDNAATYTPGGTATYVVHVTNAGPSDATGVAVTDTLPPGVTLTGAPICVATGVATCGTLSGSVGGSLFGAVGAAIAAGAGNALDYSLPVRLAPSLVADPLVNTAHASADGGALAQGADSSARNAPPPEVEIPIDDARVLGLLALLLAALGARRLARRARR